MLGSKIYGELDDYCIPYHMFAEKENEVGGLCVYYVRVAPREAHRNKSPSPHP